ncbi:MAG: hypothetical protein F6K47_33530 [Symploca sp. SIO2E6]|nr:hypothetical protein [Symploca sp. SIO2E6]
MGSKALHFNQKIPNELLTYYLLLITYYLLLITHYSNHVLPTRKAISN